MLTVYSICFRFLEEEAEELRRLNEEHAAEAELKREQQIEREKAVSIPTPFGRTLWHSIGQHESPQFTDMCILSAL